MEQALGGPDGFGIKLYVLGVFTVKTKKRKSAVMKTRTNFFFKCFNSSIQPVEMKPVPNLYQNTELWLVSKLAKFEL